MPTENSKKAESTQTKNTADKSNDSELKQSQTEQQTSQETQDQKGSGKEQQDKPKAKPKRVESIPFSKADADELKYKQSVEPDTIEHIEGNVDPSYKLPAHERNMVHARIDTILPYDPATGQRQSAPFPQKFWPKEFHEAKKRGGFNSYTVDILHKPLGLELLEKQDADKAKKEQE